LGYEGEESKITAKYISPTNRTKYFRPLALEVLNPTDPVDNIEITSTPTKTPKQLYDVQEGVVESARLHQPKNVIISLRSKGTLNHPKIKFLKGSSPPYNINIKVVPMSTVGFLKSHLPLHIHENPSKLLVPLKDISNINVEPIYQLDRASSMASKITKTKKTPTTVSYITLNPEGKLLHQHIRTFVPVRSQSFGNKESQIQTLDNEDIEHLLDTPTKEERREEPKYRVKRSDENDKYINSKESLELKRFLLQKYADILLSNEKADSKSAASNFGAVSTEKYVSSIKVPTTTIRNVGGFVNRNLPPYSSRYNAAGAQDRAKVQVESKPVEQDVKQEEAPNRLGTFGTRKPKVRFPKLNMNSRSRSDNGGAILSSSEPNPVRLTTTTTTTTEPPPSTTTRMYKPKMVYHKQYGRPLQRVDMFAVLRRQPSPNIERTIIATTTENTSETTESEPPLRKRHKPKRLQQFEHRRISKEEVFTKTYAPIDELKDRSDKAEVYDSIYDHPDLRGPVARRSRDSPAENYHEMLVYMVNPASGMGEWKFMPVPAKTISRRDMSSAEMQVSPSNKKSRKKIRHKARPYESYSDADDDHLEGQSRDEDSGSRDRLGEESTTIIPKQLRNKGRRKSNRGKHRHKAYQNSGSLRKPSDYKESTSSSLEDTVSTTATVAPSISTTTTTTTNTTTNTNNTTSSSSTVNPKIIMEPHKRKYFYAKI